MSEFAPICIYLVISLLVFSIRFGLSFPFCHTFIFRLSKNLLRLLFPHLPRFRQFLYSFLILFALLGVCYCFFLCIGKMEFFHDLLSKAVLFF
jgi:hypothetical protein